LYLLALSASDEGNPCCSAEGKIVWMNARPPQFGLKHLMLSVTAICVLCGAGLAWAAYLRELAGEKGYVPLGTMHFTVLMIVLAGMALFGLLVAIPLWVLAWWRRPK
jgi:hypothetical protein